jgi:hypothetical protein
MADLIQLQGVPSGITCAEAQWFDARAGPNNVGKERITVSLRCHRKN